MKPFRYYFSLFLTEEQNTREALKECKKRYWEEPAEEDCLRDTVIDRKRLDFLAWLVERGKLQS